MVYDPLADRRRRGIPQGPQKWPKALLRNACGRLNIAPPGTPYRSLGQGRALAVIAKAPAVAPKRYSVAFAPQSFWLYSGPPWTRESRRFSKKTWAPCEAPITIPWRSGMRKRVVRVQRRQPGGQVRRAQRFGHSVSGVQAMTEQPLPGNGEDIQDADEVPDPPNDEVVDEETDPDGVTTTTTTTTETKES